MAIEYISYLQTENIFKAWPTLQGMKESLQMDIDRLKKVDESEIDDYIYTQVIGNKALSDVPPSGAISDTTGNTANSYSKIIKRDYNNTLESIMEEKFCIDLVDDKLSIAFRRLKPANQQILKLFYWEKKTWSEVLDELKKDKHFMSKRQMQIQRRDSLYEIQRVSKITVDMYSFVMGLVEVE